METRENTLSARERYILAALTSDPDQVTRRRAKVLLDWARNVPAEVIAAEAGVKPSQVRTLTRTFSQKRLELFGPSSIERAASGIAGTISREALLRKLVTDKPRAEYVCDLALQLFDATSDVHHVPPDWRPILEIGAKVHALGVDSDENVKEYRGGRDLVLSYNITGLTPQQRDVIACLASFHRKKAHLTKDLVFASLDSETRRITLALASILRVADGLDFSRTQSTKLVAINVGHSVEVMVEGPHASEDAARANKRADLWKKHLSSPFHARTANSPRARAPRARRSNDHIDAREPITRAGSKIFAIQLARIHSLEDQARARQDPIAIHDMRVATRRLRSAFKMFRPYYSKRAFKKLGKTQRSLAHALGDVRNLDVRLEHLDAFVKTLPEEKKSGLDALTSDWQRRRSKAHQELVELLDGSGYDQWIGRMEDFIEEERGKNGARVADVLPAMMWKKYGKLRSFEPQIKDASPKALHSLRVRIKEFRYALEFFATALGASSAFIEPLVALQDHLGALHDCLMTQEAIAEYLAAWARHSLRHPDSANDYEQVVAYLRYSQKQMTELRKALPDLWQVIMRPAYRKAFGEALAAL